jgi:hypothetical protein
MNSLQRFKSILSVHSAAIVDCAIWRRIGPQGGLNGTAESSGLNNVTSLPYPIFVEGFNLEKV